MKNEKGVLSTIAYFQRLKSCRTSGASMLTTLLLAGAASTAATAQTLKTLHSFDGTDGRYPYAGLVQGTDGDLYGTTSSGGNNGTYGTVFKITSDGTLKTLWKFCSGGGYCTDGENPYATLLLGTDGNFYGTTQAGGANHDGTVFKITPSGKLTTLHGTSMEQHQVAETVQSAPICQAAVAQSSK